MELKVIANIDAEKEVLGAILVNNNGIMDALEVLDSTDFYLEKHQLLFTVMVTLFKSDKPIDITLISENIEVIKVGGVGYLAELTSIGTGAITEYIKIIKEKSNLRKLQNILYKSLEDIDKKNFEEILNISQTSILKLGVQDNSRYVTDEEIMSKSINMIEQHCKNGDDLLGIASGIKDLDLTINGFRGEKLYVIAGRPAMGKSALALNIAHNISKHSYVDYYSLEMGETEIGVRRLGMETLLDTIKINYGKLDSKEWERIARASNEIASRKCSTCCEPRVHINTIIAESKRKKAKGKLDMIIVDHIGYMDMRGMGDSLREQTSNICAEFKVLSKELNIPIIILSQLSRSVEMRADKRPMLSDLKESSGIEENADVVMFVYRDEYYYHDSDKKGIMECIIGKQRDGRTGTIELAWRGMSQRVSSLERYR